MATVGAVNGLRLLLGGDDVELVGSTLDRITDEGQRRLSVWLPWTLGAS